MSEQRTQQNQQNQNQLPFNTDAAQQVLRANTNGWAQITQELVDQTFDNLGLSFEIGRRMASSRTVTEFLSAQAELGHQSIDQSLQRGRKISDVSLNMTREITQCITDQVNQAAEAAAQQTRAMSDSMRGSADQLRNAIRSGAQAAGQATGQTGSETNPGQGQQKRGQGTGAAAH
jgi:phasin family protein